MNSIDATTWQALGLTLTVVGLLISVVLWRRRGAASGLRGVAWSLLPAAAGLTGTLRLAWNIGDQVASWAVRLVFSPVVWAGIVLAGVSVVLFGVSAAMRARGAGSATAKAAPQKTSLRRSQKSGELPQQRSTAAAPAAPADPELDDIEAILRKHGIQ